MEIEVKASQVVKTGTNKNGPWELIRVTSVDGTEYTTFDKKAKHQGTGAIIDIGEVEIKGNKISFKEIVKVVREGQAPAAGPGNFKQDPAKIHSIESQKRADIIAQLWIADKIDDKSLEVTKLRSWLKKLGIDADGWEDLESAATRSKATEMPPQPPQTASKDNPEDNGTARLLNRVCEVKGFKSDKTARTWLVNVCKINKDRIDSEPEKVLAEVEQLF